MSLTDARLNQAAVDLPDLPGALCMEIGADGFFPDPGESTRAARATCAKCPVAAKCLTYALEHCETFGIWGGTTPHERKRMQRAAR